MRQRALSVPCTCWEIPIPQKMIDAFAVAYSRATSRIVCALIPVVLSEKPQTNTQTSATQ